jgi:4-diphosphocytidyl-2-C-methyl-D-erythritol kinase
MHVRQFATYAEVVTPAKINLFLEVLAKRSDGYHEVETILTAVTLYDTLVFTPCPDSEIKLACRWSIGLSALEVDEGGSMSSARELLLGEIPGGPENLAWRAAALLRERAGIRLGATMCLVKRIPAASGLGGASSDAAAALVAANAAWRLDWPRARLAELAAELGSDVPFFLTRGAAVCRGRGEQIEKIPVARLHVVIVRPPIGLATPTVYKECRPKDSPRGAALLIASLGRGEADNAGRQLLNDLQPAAARLTPWITTLQKEFEKQDVLGHQMSGSGSSYFGLCRSHRHTRRIAARLRARGIGAVFAATTAVSG